MQAAVALTCHTLRITVHNLHRDLEELSSNWLVAQRQWLAAESTHAETPTR